MKKATLSEKKLRFEPKTDKKIGFLGVSGSTLKRFGISLYDFDDAQTQKITTQVVAQKFATIKKGKLFEKKLRFDPKTFKKIGFSVYTGLHLDA